MSKFKKALAKAKQDRESGFQEILSENKAIPIGMPQTDDPQTASKKNTEDHSLGLEISYSKTKVQKIDPKLMQEGNIFSLFHDYEISDQIKTLRTQIVSKLKQIGGNSLLITSANPYEGKTFLSINLGVSIAQEFDKTVMLIDADLRKPTKQHKDFIQDFFQTTVKEGLSDYLLNGHDIPELLINPGIDKLVILPAGKALPNSAELLGSPKMQRLVKEMKSRYANDRIIIFDTSSILTSSDPLVLANYVDGILLVVEKDKTTSEQLKKTRDLLKDKPILGAVINKKE